jgi:hypothetical protein
MCNRAAGRGIQQRIASHRIAAQQQVRHHVLDLPVGMAHALRYGANTVNLGSTWLSSIRMTLHKVQTFTSVRLA